MIKQKKNTPDIKTFPSSKYVICIITTGKPTELSLFEILRKISPSKAGNFFRKEIHFLHTGALIQKVVQIVIFITFKLES